MRQEELGVPIFGHRLSSRPDPPPAGRCDMLKAKVLDERLVRLAFGASPADGSRAGEAEVECPESAVLSQARERLRNAGATARPEERLASDLDLVDLVLGVVRKLGRGHEELSSRKAALAGRVADLLGALGVESGLVRGLHEDGRAKTLLSLPGDVFDLARGQPSPVRELASLAEAEHLRELELADLRKLVASEEAEALRALASSLGGNK